VSVTRFAMLAGIVRQDWRKDRFVLHAFLRSRRGGALQREVASSARIRLSRYRKLESGDAAPLRLDELLRLADALSLKDAERLSFVRLARPDLAFALRAAESPPSEAPWRFLHNIAGRLRETRGSREPVHVAVEIVHAMLGPDLSVLALTFDDEDTWRLDYCIGVRGNRASCAEGLQIAPTALPREGIHVETPDKLRAAFVPLSRDRGVSGALAVAYRHDVAIAPRSLLFLGLVSALLETRLGNRFHTGRAWNSS
jgi:hypothetical protein